MSPVGGTQTWYLLNTRHSVQKVTGSHQYWPIKSGCPIQNVWNLHTNVVQINKNKIQRKQKQWAKK